MIFLPSHAATSSYYFLPTPCVVVALLAIVSWKRNETAKGPSPPGESCLSLILVIVTCKARVILGINLLQVNRLAKKEL
jgi:hypothetical protein